MGQNNLFDELRTPDGYSLDTAGVLSNLLFFGLLPDEGRSKKYFLESSIVNPSAVTCIDEHRQLIYDDRQQHGGLSSWGSKDDIRFDEHIRMRYILTLENLLNRHTRSSFFMPALLQGPLREGASDGVWMDNTWPTTHVLYGTAQSHHRLVNLLTNFVQEEEVKDILVKSSFQQGIDQSYRAKSLDALRIYDFLRLSNIPPFLIDSAYSVVLSAKEFKAVANMLVQRNFVKSDSPTGL